MPCAVVAHRRARRRAITTQAPHCHRASSGFLARSPGWVAGARGWAAGRGLTWGRASHPGPAPAGAGTLPLASGAGAPIERACPHDQALEASRSAPSTRTVWTLAEALGIAPGAPALAGALHRGPDANTRTSGGGPVTEAMSTTERAAATRGPDHLASAGQV